MLPSNCDEETTIDYVTDDINRTVAVEGLTGKELIETLCDAETFVALGDAYATEMITGFACFGGVTCGVVANDAAVNGGVITCDGAKKAAKLIGFADSFSIPVVTLVDSTGVESGAAAEDAPLAAQLGKLAMAYATATCPKITVINGHAICAAFVLLGSKSLGADLVYATESSEIGALTAASRVAFAWDKYITEEKTREELISEWKTTVSSPANAAASGEIDDIIGITEMRARICSALLMLSAKGDASAIARRKVLPL
jgi:acetyl-CoA carboxylase carboxyltransferase component